jgi:hypothetical protein
MAPATTNLGQKILPITLNIRIAVISYKNAKCGIFAGLVRQQPELSNKSILLHHPDH